MAAKNPYLLRARDVLSKEAVTIAGNDTLRTALDLMTECRLTALPVVDSQGRCAGILSASDIVEITRNIDEEMHDLGRGDEASYAWLRDNLAEHDMGRRSVEEFMTGNVATVTAEHTLPEAAREMPTASGPSLARRGQEREASRDHFDNGYPGSLRRWHPRIGDRLLRGPNSVFCLPRSSCSSET